MHVTGTVPHRLRPRRTLPAAPPTPTAPPTARAAHPPLRTARRHRAGHAAQLGNIIGGGIFLLPASIAPYGTISLLAFGVLTVGAIALALVFGRLAERDPRTGGPYVYAREAFGDFAGFLAAWAYWITTWVSNAALAVAAVGYLDVLIPVNEHRWTACLAALVIQWLPALANYAGTRYVGAVQVVSTVLKLVPLLLVAVGGLFAFDADNLGPFQASGESAMGAVSAAAAILLFSYLGVESAAVSAGEVRDPGAPWAAPPSSAPPGRRSSICWAPSPSSARSPTTGSWSPARPSRTPSTACSAGRGAAGPWRSPRSSP